MSVRARWILIALTLTGMSAQAFSAPPKAAASITLPSGVVVMSLKQGTGSFPAASDTVKVHYRGTLTNGKEFDSSYKRNAPISFPLKQVIACWTQGVQKMQVGGKARLVCPAQTAYGARGVPGVIPPNSVLMFEVELLAIEG